MLPLHYARRWRQAGVALLVLVFIAALMPAVWLWPNPREFMAWFDNVDKLLHGATFLFLAVWFSGQYRPRSYWRIGLGLIAFGMLIEVCQRAVGYRTADWFDLAADVVGVVLGLLIALAGLGGWTLRIEDRLRKQESGAGID
jgi:VanZ family protein